MGVIAENSSSTVTIDLGNGNTITKVVKNYDSLGNIDLNSNTPTGYHINNFKDTNNNSVSSDTIITQDITITPIFEPNTYTVSFDTDNDGEPDTEIAQRVSLHHIKSV